MSIAPFWVVWNPDRAAPMTRHSREKDAKNEAKRLASQHLTESFFVLCAIGRAQTEDPVEWTDVDHIPF